MNRSLFVIEPAMIALILGTIVLLALGQVLFKFAAVGIQFSQPRTLFSLSLIIALTVYGIATVAWLAVLARVPLSLAFPFYGLTFLLVPLLAWMILKEPIRPQVLWGGLLIMMGVVVSSIGDHR